eukprot:snap_masked-scaffold_6-processed-gene-7.30-mRNA-1 protein AED:1.00 eAED:1.00 QI:0/0/0/0/1/1/2/0/105
MKDKTLLDQLSAKSILPNLTHLGLLLSSCLNQGEQNAIQFPNDLDLVWSKNIRQDKEHNIYMAREIISINLIAYSPEPKKCFFSKDSQINVYLSQGLAMISASLS